MAVFCQQCGAGLPLSARFCSRCGAAIQFNPTAPPMPGRPLIRPRAGRQVAGVCLAIARSNGWDVAAVRVIAVLSLCFSVGLVGIAYLACWIGIPEEPLLLPGSYPSSTGEYPPGI